MKEIYKLRTLKRSMPSGQRQHSQENASKSQKSRYTERPWAFSISNRKKEELEKQRLMEIELEQKALNFRMTEIKSNKKHSQHIDHENIYLKHPLHENVRKEHFRIIREENLAQRKRVENSRGTINIRKIQKDWTQKQTIRHFLSKYQKSMKKNSIAHSIQTHHDLLSHQSQKVLKMEKERQISGTKILLTVEQYNHVVIVSGFLTVENQRVVMVVDRRKLDQILHEKCKGKLTNFINSLDFDPTITSLYYLTEDPLIQDEFISDICSEFDLSTLKKSIMKQHMMLSIHRYKQNIEVKKQALQKMQKNETPQTNGQSMNQS